MMRQHNTTQQKTRQDKITQYNTIQYNTTLYNTIQHNTIKHNTRQYYTGMQVQHRNVTDADTGIVLQLHVIDNFPDISKISHITLNNPKHQI